MEMKYFVVKHARKVLAMFVVLLIAGVVEHPPTIAFVPHMLIDGILLSVPIMLGYRTDKPIYAILFGAMLPLGLIYIFDRGNIRSQSTMDFLLVSACLGSGIFLPFALFKKHVADFVGVNIT